MDWSLKILADWKKANASRVNSNTSGGTGLGDVVQRWKPPDEGCLKVNVDASMFEEAETFSVGMVLRDFKGRFIEGKILRLPKPDSVFEAEAIGVCEALSWIETKAIPRAIIESDSLTTVQAINRRTENQLEVGHILHNCWLSLQNNPGISVSFIRKHANKVAHELARIPCLISCCNVFMSPPSLLLETLLFDSAN